MFIEAKKLIGLPIAAEDTGSKVGAVNQIIIDPLNGKILGFIVRTKGFFSTGMALSIVDIREWDPAALVTNSEENIVDPKEIIRLNEIYEQNFNFLELSAATESGTRLGKVDDLLIDTDTETIAKYYLKDILGTSRVLSADKVIKVDKQIIFQDDVGEIPTGAQGAIT